MANPHNIVGKEFKPGQSGNPAGRTPGIPNIKTRWMRLLTILEDKKNPVTGEIEKFSVMEQIDMKLFAAALKGNVAAIDKIYDRLEGKPMPTEDKPQEINVVFRNAVPQPKEK